MNSPPQTYWEVLQEKAHAKTDAELAHQLTLLYQSLNRIVMKKAANWQVAYRENIYEQNVLLTEMFNRKNSKSNETEEKNLEQKPV